HSVEGVSISGGFVRLTALRETLPSAPLELPTLREGMEAGLMAYIPGAVLKRLSALESGWLPELRWVTVLFINLPDLNYTTPLEQAQKAMRTLQTALYRYEGSVNKISVDDKGTILVAVLGLPPFAHEDDAVRGVQAALAMQDELTTLGWRSSIGVTTGQVFCGPVGNDVRREYTVMGDVVNLAARLMQVAAGEIRVDTVTYRDAQYRILFNPLPPVQIKGKATPVVLYRPQGEEHHIVHAQTQMVGRDQERAVIAARLQTLLRGGPGNVLLIEGEAGIGKSRLVQDLVRQAEALGIEYLMGAGDAIEKATTYHAWRPVFRQIFGMDTPGKADSLTLKDEQRAHILQQFEGDPDLQRLAPLLNDVLPLNWEDNEFTQDLAGELRANNTLELLVHLLQDSARQAPKVLILEDAHWLDSNSWALARAAQRVRSLLMVIVTRPMGEQAPAQYRKFLTTWRGRQDAGPHHLVLDVLPPADVMKLVSQRLGVSRLPDAVTKLIHEKAEGHPFFAEE
ncbi:MAG: AAA family ATPase, partial [Anaerolineales bacterium]